MKLKYEARKGQRFKKRIFFGVTNFEGWWWNEDLKIWHRYGANPNTNNLSSHFMGCKSVKAFRRRLRQWSRYLPEGIQFILASRYEGQDVYGRTKRSSRDHIRHG